jgi:hypothetical protein
MCAPYKVVNDYYKKVKDRVIIQDMSQFLPELLSIGDKEKL